MSEEDRPLLAGLWQLALDGQLVIPPDVWEAMVERARRVLCADWGDDPEAEPDDWRAVAEACLRAALSLPETETHET